MNPASIPGRLSSLRRLPLLSWRLRDWLSLWRTATVSRYATGFLLFVFFLVSMTYQLHTCSKYIDIGASDENWTLFYGIKHLNPLGPSNPNLEVGETTRWFARLLFPGGLYYMIRHRGGHAFKDYRSYTSYLGEEWFPRGVTGAVLTVPDVQDFTFFMRVSFGALAIGSFCLVLWALSRRVNLAAALAYGGMILANGALTDVPPWDHWSMAPWSLYPIAPSVWSQLSLFYTETALFIIFNLAAFLCLRRSLSHRAAAYLGILAAAALSTKLSGVILAAVMFARAALAGRDLGQPAKLRVEVFLLFFLAFLFLIHVNAASLQEVINDTMWNVYHYTVGGPDAIPGKGNIFGRIIQDTGFFAVPLFVAALAWLLKAPKISLIPVYLLGAGVIFTSWSFSNSSLYLPRNMASLYVWMSFIIALAVGDLVGKTLANRPNLQAGALLGLALAFLVSAAALVADLPSLADTLFEENKERLQNCDSIGAMGLAKSDLRTLRENVTGDVAAFPGLRGPFKKRADYSMTPWILDLMFEGKEPRTALDQEFQRLLRHDCLVAHRQGDTREITNFLAPQQYRELDRAGNFFFFASKQVKTSRGRIIPNSRKNQRKK